MRKRHTSTLTTKDCTEIHYEEEMSFLASRGFHCIAHDRWGHGQFSHPFTGNVPIAAFYGLRTAVQADRSQFFKDLSLPFYGYYRPNAKVSESVRESFWLRAMACGFPGAYA